MYLGRCVLLKCRLPVETSHSYVKLPTGGIIHFECLIQWRREGGAMVPPEKKQEVK